MRLAFVTITKEFVTMEKDFETTPERFLGLKPLYSLILKFKYAIAFHANQMVMMGVSQTPLIRFPPSAKILLFKNTTFGKKAERPVKRSF